MLPYLAVGVLARSRTCLRIFLSEPVQLAWRARLSKISETECGRNYMHRLRCLLAAREKSGGFFTRSKEAAAVRVLTSADFLAPIRFDSLRFVRSQFARVHLVEKKTIAERRSLSRVTSVRVRNEKKAKKRRTRLCRCFAIALLNRNALCVACARDVVGSQTAQHSFVRCAHSAHFSFSQQARQGKHTQCSLTNALLAV